jgi:exodeoxyribonuclease VII large subunit
MDSMIVIPKTYSLHEVMQSIQSVLQKNYSSKTFWVRCEIARINLHDQSGHCYLELIDKNETTLVAQMKGIIWSDHYQHIAEKFEKITKSPLGAGMKVLIQSSVSFHPLFGLSLTITDIEPSFTLGELAKMKSDSIERLKSEGLFNLNQKLTLPKLPGRIALISVSTSRGYLDFIRTLENHSKQYSIKCTLFEAVLQGENALPTITKALSTIFTRKNKFDAIAIIRGGAGDAGLACYDEYSLASFIARSPLPVITGIGHASNETVTEMVAFKNCITPTAAATFILEKFDTQLLSLIEMSGIITGYCENTLSKSKKTLQFQSKQFSLLVVNRIQHSVYQLKNQVAGLPSSISLYVSLINQQIRNSQDKIIKTSEYIRSKDELINHISEKISLLDPVNILRRGFSITRKNGIALHDTADLAEGDTIETQLTDGKITSVIKK